MYKVSNKDIVYLNYCTSGLGVSTDSKSALPESLSNIIKNRTVYVDPMSVKFTRSVAQEETAKYS